MSETFDGFKKGRPYTREFINEQLGGGMVDYLPHNDGRVLCGCFRKDFNPNAPDVVLVGKGKKIEHYAAVFCNQEVDVPIFIKYRSNEWVYMGDYHVSSWTEDPEELKTYHMKAGWEESDPVTRVMFLRRSL
jgi:hypothetical protein